MIHIEIDNEELEKAYWHFDTLNQKKNLSERECFKMTMRGIFTNILMNKLYKETEIPEENTIKKSCENCAGECTLKNIWEKSPCLKWRKKDDEVSDIRI